MNNAKLMEHAAKAGYLSLGQLGKEAHIPRSTWSATVNGHRDVKISEINKICALIRVTDGAVKAEIFLN